MCVFPFHLACTRMGVNIYTHIHLCAAVHLYINCFDCQVNFFWRSTSWPHCLLLGSHIITEVGDYLPWCQRMYTTYTVKKIESGLSEPNYAQYFQALLCAVGSTWLYAYFLILYIIILYLFLIKFTHLTFLMVVNRSMSKKRQNDPKLCYMLCYSKAALIVSSYFLIVQWCLVVDHLTTEWKFHFKNWDKAVWGENVKRKCRHFP